MLRGPFLHYVISWALVQYAAGNLLGGGFGQYPLPPQTFIPQPPPPTFGDNVVQNPVCLEWGNNILNPVLPLRPLGGGGVEEEVVGTAGCAGYSIKISPLAPIVTEIEEEEETIEEIDDKVVLESTGQVLAEQREYFDVTNQFYPKQYGPPQPYPYFPPSQPSYPYFPPSQQSYQYFPPPPPVNFRFQTATRSLGDEYDGHS